MAALKLDFLHPLPRPHWLGWLLLLAGIGAAAWTAWHNRQLDAALADESARASRLQMPGPTPRQARRTATPESTEVLSAREQLTLPWSRLLAGLEAAQSKRIALLALDADGRKPDATLTAEARNLRDMLAYMETLKQRGGFNSVVLASHQLRDEDPQKPVHFVLRLRWRP